MDFEQLNNYVEGLIAEEMRNQLNHDEQEGGDEHELDGGSDDEQYGGAMFGGPTLSSITDTAGTSVCQDAALKELIAWKKNNPGANRGLLINEEDKFKIVREDCLKKNPNIAARAMQVAAEKANAAANVASTAAKKAVAGAKVASNLAAKAASDTAREAANRAKNIAAAASGSKPKQAGGGRRSGSKKSSKKRGLKK
jgi:hypothetical protein